MLKIHELTVQYGAIRAIDQVSINVKKREILSIIGANGAGKSTLLRAVSGLMKPRSGWIEFEGHRIEGLRPDKIVRLGIVMVPEGRRIFPELTVRENLDLGGYVISDKRLKNELSDLITTTFPRLKERMKQHAGTLSGGEQQMLAMGRALMGNPKLLLLDEPSMGLSPLVTKEIFSLVSLINREKGISMILVEQNARMALEHSGRTYVLENGRITKEDESAAMKDDPTVVESYLGV